MSISLSRDRAPVVMVMSRRGTSSASASAAQTASLALPSTAGAVTATTRATPSRPSQRPPTTARRAPGLTRTAKRLLTGTRYRWAGAVRTSADQPVTGDLGVDMGDRGAATTGAAAT